MFSSEVRWTPANRGKWWMTMARMKTKKAKAGILASVHETAAGLRRIGVIGKATLREFAGPDLTPMAPLAPEQPERRTSLSPRGPVEISQGEGLGERLSADEGRRRVRAYALAAGPAFEDWAGPTAGPVEVERKLGIPRSTLHAWHAKGLVIGLLNGVRRNVFPLEQFVEGKPVVGLADVLAVIGEPRTAWTWLKEPHPRLGGAAPLARLKRGGLDEVLSVARTNFGP